MEFNTIDQFLTTLEGPVESSGSFSLNLNSARQKLESYQLPDPGLYPIFLVAAAVPSGATEFDVWTDSEKIRFEFNGSPFQVDELQALKGFLFASGETPPRLSNLAIALTAARQLSSTFEFRSGQALLSCSEEGWTVRQEQAIKKTRLIIPRHQSFLAKWKSTEPDLQDILSVCRFAPLTFRFNAEYAGWHWSFRLPVIHRVLRTDCTELRMGRLPQAYGCHTQTVDSPGPYGGAIALVRDDDPRDLQVVVDGISHPIPIQAHGMEGVIWHDGLTRDLSCTQLIHDQKMEDFLRQLEAQIDDMVYERVSSSEAFHAREREVLEPLAEKAAAHYSGLGDEDKAERILLWVQAEEQDLPDLSTSCGFAELTTRLTELTEASHGLVLQSRALEVLIGHLTQSSRNHKWRETQEVVNRIRALYTRPKRELELLAQCLEALNSGEATEIELDEWRPEDQLQQALLHMVDQNWESAREILTTAQAGGFKRDANRLLAHGYLNRLQPERALECARRALDQVTSLEPYFKEREQSEALRRHRENNAVYRELVADCLAEMGRSSEALAVRIEALPESPRDKALQASRLEYIKRTGAQVMPFWMTVKWHLKALKMGWAAETDRNEQRIRLETRLKKYLRHETEDIDPEWFFCKRNFDSPWSQFFMERVLREMRLRSKVADAEQLIVSYYLKKRAKALWTKFLYGARRG